MENPPGPPTAPGLLPLSLRSRPCSGLPLQCHILHPSFKPFSAAPPTPSSAPSPVTLHGAPASRHPDFSALVPFSL